MHLEFYNITRTMHSFSAIFIHFIIITFGCCWFCPCTGKVRTCGLWLDNWSWIWLFRNSCNCVGWKFNCFNRDPLCWAMKAGCWSGGNWAIFCLNSKTILFCSSVSWVIAAAVWAAAAAAWAPAGAAPEPGKNNHFIRQVYMSTALAWGLTVRTVCWGWFWSSICLSRASAYMLFFQFYHYLYWND